MGNIPIALQLYSVRGEAENSLPDTLKSTADLGYVGAEPWGYGGEEVAWMGHGAADIRRMYDDNGMTCCGIHLQTTALLGDNLKRTIEFNQICGNKFLIIAADSVRMGSVEGIAELVGILNDTAEVLKPHGMETGYHAHAFDFAVIDGEIAWDRLFSATVDEVVMQMDVGNCASGGGDPVGMLRKYPGRARSMHLKDHGGPDDAVIGEGDADWPTIFELCETQHATEWYVVEEGGKDGLGFGVCKRSLEALKAMGK